jgi:sulfur-carrier protein
MTQPAARDERAETGVPANAANPANPANSVPRAQVRYWAAAKAAAGVAEEFIEGRTVAEVLDAARERHVHEPRFDKVLSVCSFLVGETPLGERDPATVPVADGDVLDVLPPFAGG